MPNFVIVQPANAVETRMAVEYCVNEATDNCVLRLIIGPSPRLLELPADYKLAFGRGITLTDGNDAALFAYGPVMIHEALVAAERLSESGFGLRVINMPWLNRVDADWLRQAIGDMQSIYALEDHAPVGGLGDSLLNALVANGLMKGQRFEKFAIEGYPAWGTPPEALKFHRVDGASLAERILRNEA